MEATRRASIESEALAFQHQALVPDADALRGVAHRYRTIRRADQISVVEAEEVAEHGTHATLFELGGRYYDLYTRQHGIKQTCPGTRGRQFSIEEDREGEVRSQRMTAKLMCRNSRPSLRSLVGYSIRYPDGSAVAGFTAGSRYRSSTFHSHAFAKRSSISVDQVRRELLHHRLRRD